MQEPNAKDPVKHKAILDAARKLFVQGGYEKTTIPQIAREAGIAVGTVYLYFRSKHEILTHISLEIGANIEQAFRNLASLDIPLRELPQAIVETSFRVGQHKREQMQWLEINKESPEYLAKRKERNEQATRAVEELLSRAIARGELAPCNSEVYAQFVVLLGHATLQQCFVVEGGEREQWYRQGMVEFLERLLL